MKKQIFNIIMFVAVIAAFSNCTTYNHSMREPNTRLNLTKSDFTLSDQVTAKAKSVTVLGIDWRRFFNAKTGSVDADASSSINWASIPVIGDIVGDRTASYSLYEMMNANPGYDVVFYPQYETKVFKPALGIGFLVRITNVKTTARLGKLNK
jgi:hypothetical protein